MRRDQLQPILELQSRLWQLPEGRRPEISWSAGDCARNDGYGRSEKRPRRTKQFCSVARLCAMDGARARSEIRSRKARSQRDRERERERETERKKESKQASKQASKEGRKEERKKEVNKERKTAGRARARLCAMDGRAHAPERRGQSALCKEKDRERNT